MVVVAAAAAAGGVFGSINAAWVVNPQVKEQTGPMFKMTANTIKSHAALMGTRSPHAYMSP
jgi:membrane associated rhomboid family serine protease